MLLRFVQGFALGGEWGGAVLMSVEHAPDGRRGLFGSVVALGLPAGIILSNLVFLIASTSVAADEFAAWAWRVPFVASAVLVGVGLWVRLGISESPVFARTLQAHAARRMPIVDVLRMDARTVLLAAGSYLSISSLGYVRAGLLRDLRDPAARPVAAGDADDHHARRRSWQRRRSSCSRTGPIASGGGA